MFKSNDNADFYDTMMANGAFIQLGSFLLNPKTTTTAAAIVKSAQEYESYQITTYGKSSPLDTLEDDVANYVGKISD